eukprot:3166670-Prymnesium_polylepis.3
MIGNDLPLGIEPTPQRAERSAACYRAVLCSIPDGALQDQKLVARVENRWKHAVRTDPVLLTDDDAACRRILRAGGERRPVALVHVCGAARLKEVGARRRLREREAQDASAEHRGRHDLHDILERGAEACVRPDEAIPFDEACTGARARRGLLKRPHVLQQRRHRSFVHAANVPAAALCVIRLPRPPRAPRHGWRARA